MYVKRLHISSISTLSRSMDRAGTLLVLYVVVGTLYNYLVLDLRGVDLVPRYSVFSLQDTLHLLSSVKDRLVEAKDRFLYSRRGGWSSGVSTGYRGVASSREEEAGILGGPSGFLDEEDEDEEAPADDSQGYTSHPSTAGLNADGVIRL